MTWEETYKWELELKDYLNNHTEVIEKSLEKTPWMTYDFIKVNRVDIYLGADDNEFIAHCQLIEGLPYIISPYLPIPKQFLRKMKLKSLK